MTSSLNPCSVFLSQMRHSGSSRPSHMSMLHPRGKYMIPMEQLDAFMELYCQTYTDHAYGLLENSQSILPVLADIDMKKEWKPTSILGQSSQNEEENKIKMIQSPPPLLFDFDFIQHIVFIYQKVLTDILEISNPDDVFCVVLQKNPYWIQKNGRYFIKNGFHLHFPKLFVSKLVQSKELLPRIKLEYKKQNKFPTFSMDWFLDMSYCRGHGSPWLLYGSRKDMDMEPYLISHIIDAHGKVYGEGEWQRYLKDQFVDIPYFHPDSVRHKQVEGEGTVGANLEYYLPYLLSVLPYHRDMYIKEVKTHIQPLDEIFSTPKYQSSMNSQLQKISPYCPGNPDLTPVTSTSSSSMATETEDGISIELVDDLLDLLDPQRSRDRNDWMYVGWILYNIFQGSQEGFERWIDFSKRSPDVFDEHVCVYEWARMAPKNVTMGSLKYIAKMDEPEKYVEIMKKYSRVHIEKALKLNGTHHDLAKALFEKHECEFICASIKDKIWFQFKGHVWERNEEGFSLRSKISSEIVQTFEDMALELHQKFARADKEEASMYKKKIESVMRLVMHLKSAPYKTNIMKEAMEVFYQPKFFSKLDADPYLFAFQNGVMDLRTFEFRPGRPQDFLSVQAPIRYRTEFDDTSEDIRQVEDFLSKIFPDVDVRQYFLNVSCDIFLGGNTHKIVQFWSGEGDNGKSVTEKLFEKMLGSYAVKLPTSLIVGKRTQSSQACPELVRAGNGVRMAMLQEPDGKDVINIGILKELSGNDSFFARGLYKEGQEISPMFKLILICNEPPKIPGHDKATRNRIRVIPFESTFVDADVAPDDPLEQLRQKKFPKDKDFMNKIPQMTEAFAWYLLRHFRTRSSQWPEPEKVKMATSNYLMKNDIYRQFCDEMIIEEEGGELHLNDVYQVFKDWYHDSIPNEKVPNKSEMKDYLVKHWGPMGISQKHSRANTWFNKSLRGMMDNVFL